MCASLPCPRPAGGAPSLSSPLPSTPFLLAVEALSLYTQHLQMEQALASQELSAAAQHLDACIRLLAQQARALAQAPGLLTSLSAWDASGEDSGGPRELPPHGNSRPASSWTTAALQAALRLDAQRLPEPYGVVASTGVSTSTGTSMLQLESIPPGGDGSPAAQLLPAPLQQLVRHLNSASTDLAGVCREVVHWLAAAAHQVAENQEEVGRQGG